MKTVEVRLVTIIAEGVLEERIVADFRRLGAKGYNRSDVHGHGTRGITENFWQGAQVKLETLVSAEVGDKILEYVAKTYFADYAVVAYIESVEVVRGEKFL